MGLFRKAKKAIKAPAGFAVGLDRAEAGTDKTVIQTRRPILIVYFADDGWRWRLVASNGKITADSGEAYIRRFDAKIAALRLVDVAGSARLEVRDR